MKSIRGYHTLTTVEAIIITIEVESKQSLFVLLSSDGSINRLGSGLVEDKEAGTLFIGVTKDNLFEKVKEEMKEEWLERTGVYNLPDQKGKYCKLAILLNHEDKSISSYEFHYGAESQGPPDEVCEFVAKAIEATEPWYQQQLRRGQQKNRNQKAWWKFWE
jgi:hypothetical protein